MEYFGQWTEWEEILNSFTGTGTGNFPLDVEIHWEYVGGEVPAATHGGGPSTQSAIYGKITGIPRRPLEHQTCARVD